MPPSIAVEDLKEKIELFLLEHSRPILSEPGQEVMDLSSSSYSFSTQYGKLLWHIWNEQTNVVRQITGINKESKGRMELRYQKFGKGPAGTLVLADSRARPDQLDRRARRTQYLRTLRRWLNQLFPQWKVEELTTEADLARSFSGRYARGLISRGNQAWAVIGTGDREDASTADGILAYGLVWLDWLRQRTPDRVIAGLKLFLPAGKTATTQTRLAWLDPRLAQWELYETSDDAGDEARQCDIADIGNLKTNLAPLPRLAPGAPSGHGWAQRIHSWSRDIEARRGPDGSCSWSVRGLAFARETTKGVLFGLGRAETMLSEENAAQLRSLVNRVVRFRRPDAKDRMHPLYRLQPERWMESVLTRELGAVGYDLEEGTVYEQVPAISGTDRGLMDLLTLSRSGRLVVMELKASEDMQLPLQALDYWMRVHWHHERGDLERTGYFGGRSLSKQPPLLLLVSPALQFHPACETISRYLSPTIEVIRVGLNENWREQLQVVFRQASRSEPESGRSGVRGSV